MTFYKSFHKMDSQEVAYNCRFFKAYKNGHVHVNRPVDSKVPAGEDPITGVTSKDVIISPDIGLSARIFLPKLSDPIKKLPVLFYIHGGGFCMLSPFAAQYHNFLNLLVAEAGVIAVSVDYRLYPDRPIPACYDDSWAALQWVAGHDDGSGPEPWLNNHADFGKVFIGGDSAGANITHTVSYRVGTIGLRGIKVVGAFLVHPFFGGTVDDEMWLYMCPGNKGLNDPTLNPPAEDLAKLECEKVLVFVAEKDHLCAPGKAYYERLMRSGWKGTGEFIEHVGEEHCFHVHDLYCDKSFEVVKKIASFLKQ